MGIRGIPGTALHGYSPVVDCRFSAPPTAAFQSCPAALERARAEQQSDSPLHDAVGTAIRPPIYQSRPINRVVKVFPSCIVTEGPRRVNGKSVPFAHLRKGSGFPDPWACTDKLFLSIYTCSQLIAKGLLKSLDVSSGIPDASIRTSSLVLSLREHGEINILKKSQLVETTSMRRSPRLRLQVPVFLRGTEVSGSEFIELTKTLNISANGACIASEHILKPDQTVHLTIPRPLARFFEPCPQRDSSYRSEGLAAGVGRPDAFVWLGIPSSA